MPSFRPESQALVDVAGAGVRLGNFELDFSIPSLPSPVARPLDEEFPDALPAPIRGDPDIVDETLGLRGDETALAEDHIPEELEVRRLGDPTLRSVPCHVRFDFLSEMGFPLVAIHTGTSVRWDVVRDQLNAGTHAVSTLRTCG